MRNTKTDQNLHLRDEAGNNIFISRVVPLVVLLAIGFAIVLLEWVYTGSSGYVFKEGEPSPHSYRVISPIRYEDIAATESLREMARASVVGVVVRDVAARARMVGRLKELQQLSKPDAAIEPKYIPPQLLKVLKALPPDELQKLLKLTGEVGDSYLKRLASDDIVTSQADSQLWDEISGRGLSVDVGNMVYQVLSKVTEPGYRVDPNLTDKMKSGAEKAIPVIERQLELGDIIVAQGEVITSQTVRLLRFQGYREDHFPLTQLVIVLILVLLLPLWLEIPARDADYERPSWGCIAFVIATAWIFQTIAAQLGTAGAGILVAVVMAYLCMPRSFAFNVSLAATSTGVFIITGLSVYNLLLLLSMGFVAAMAGYYILHHIESRKNLGYKVLAFSVFLAVSRLVILWLQGFPITLETLKLSGSIGAVWLDIGRFLLFDLLSTTLAVAILPMFEGSIGVLSMLRLRELSNPSGSLLRKLQRDAPGTYQHCLSIASLAESVAVELGMDENLMKAGVYYHDIGKLRRPQFFVENQGGGFNAHDDMSPTLSAFVILSHVKDGLEMAKEYGLPKKIRDFIAEHHGTTCIRYFYNKAQSLGENVERSAFCYPGPKPRTRETALLMILDSLEAALRSESLGRELLLSESENEHSLLESEDSEAKGQCDRRDGNRGRSQAFMALQKIVDQVINSKIEEGQFDEVTFTLKDLNCMRDALIKVLMSIYHTRKVKKVDPYRMNKVNKKPQLKLLENKYN